MHIVFPSVYLTGSVAVLHALADACEQKVPFSYLWR